MCTRAWRNICNFASDLEKLTFNNKNHMKKQLFHTLLCCLLWLPLVRTQAQSTVAEGQSTEGKDFWVTFMRADQNDHSDASDKAVTLALTVSAKEECDVTFTNPRTNETVSEHLTAGSIKEVAFYTGDASETARTRTDAQKAIVTCYTYYPDSVDNSAIHVESTAPISVFASNRRSKSFDATNVLPTASLLDEYLIQTIAPSDHGDSPQGTHFCIIATEDNTIVDYCPTVPTKAMNDSIKAASDKADFMGEEALTDREKFWLHYTVGDTVQSPVMMKGQVYYIWTGNFSGASADLSGTWLKAHDKKKIAVFQGAPHTNLPDKIRDRDHLFSQAMPVQYWGNTFVITSSLTRGRDIIRVMAREDGTEVFINGELKHTFNFSSNPKRTFEFQIGESNVYCSDKNHKGNLPAPLVADSSCYITTSCPAATHLFMVSNTYDNKINDVESTGKGDPAMLWVNPIEQRINDITFATYGSSNTHYFNVVTDQAGVASMKLDGVDISADFHPVSGSNNAWYFARKNISYATHRLTGNTGFIAHVYGYGDKESYGYSAGGATKPLTQYITINGQIFSPDTENTLCGEDTIKFACHPDYEYTKIEWFFGDGKSDLTNKDSVPHFYEKSGVYPAYVLIYRESSNLCAGQNAVDSIPIKVTIGRYQFAIGAPDIPCPEDGKAYVGRIPYSNEGGVNLHGDNVIVEFDEAALADGFTNAMLQVEDSYFQITIPSGAKPETNYGIHLKITSDCGGADTVLHFMLNYDKDIITQRYNNVLGLLASTFDGKELSDYQWYRLSDSTAIEGQVSANLNSYDIPYGGNLNDAYYVCFTINKGQPDEVRTCACAKAFNTNADGHIFENDSTGLSITASYSYKGDVVFVNANWNGQKDLECYAQWIDASGHVISKHDVPDGGCTIPTPDTNGLYLLHVVTGKGSRSFKIFINK